MEAYHVPADYAAFAPPVPDEDNAAPALMALLESLTPFPQELLKEFTATEFDDWKPQHFALIKKWEQANEALLQSLPAILEKPSFRIEGKADAMPSDLALDLDQFTALQLYLAGQAYAAAQENKTCAAIKACNNIFRLANLLLQHDYGFASNSVGIRMELAAIICQGSLASTLEPTSRILHHWRCELGTIPDYLAHYRRALLGELLEVRTEYNMLPLTFTRPQELLILAMGADWMLSSLDAMQKDYAEAIHSLTALERQYAWVRRIAEEQASSISWPYGPEYHILIQEIRDTLMIAHAILEYTFRNKRYPKTLANLVPDILPRVPIDPYNGLPYGYWVDPSGQHWDLKSLGAEAFTTPPHR